MHYVRWKKHGDPHVRKHKHDGHVDKGCAAEGCDRRHFARGLCKRHYSQRPDQVAQQRNTDHKRRRTPEYRERDRVRLEKRRRAQGTLARPKITPAERAAHRRAAKHQRATRRLERAAVGTQGTRTWIAGPCESCGLTFVRRTNCTCCSRLCRRRVDRHKRRDAYGNHRERAKYYGVPYEPVKRADIFKRDGYRCQLCGRATRGKHRTPDGQVNPYAPTLDHIVPMACGGGHIYSNLQCACSACNSQKGDRSANDQLLLDVA